MVSEEKTWARLDAAAHGEQLYARRGVAPVVVGVVVVLAAGGLAKYAHDFVVLSVGPLLRHRPQLLHGLRGAASGVARAVHL